MHCVRDSRWETGTSKSPKNEMKSYDLEPILRDIKTDFHFLFDAGYQIHNAKLLPMGDWQVTLALGNFGIVIYSDRGTIDIIFSPIDSNMRYRVGLAAMVYLLSDRQVFLGEPARSRFKRRRKDFRRLADLLQEYIDRITPYFGSDYEKYEHELTLLQQECLFRFLDEYLPKKKHGW